MAEFFAETTAMYISGFPQLLREIWDHLYPGAPPPNYRVLCHRHDRATSEFTATVYLRPAPVTAGISHALTSGVSTQPTRAIQEAAGDAIVFLRTHDLVMRQCTRYVYFPRLDLDTGDILFPNPGGPHSPLAALLRYTTLLHQYLRVTLLQLASLRANVALAEMTRAPGASTARPPQLPTFTLSTLEQIRRGIARFSAPHVPAPPPHTRSRAADYYARFTPVRSQRRRVRADTPPYPDDFRGDDASTDYSTTADGSDTIPPATPLVMEF